MGLGLVIGFFTGLFIGMMIMGILAAAGQESRLEEYRENLQGEDGSKTYDSTTAQD